MREVLRFEHLILLHFVGVLVVEVGLVEALVGGVDVVTDDEDQGQRERLLDGLLKEVVGLLAGPEDRALDLHRAPLQVLRQFLLYYCFQVAWRKHDSDVVLLVDDPVIVENGSLKDAETLRVVPVQNIRNGDDAVPAQVGQEALFVDRAGHPLVVENGLPGAHLRQTQVAVQNGLVVLLFLDQPLDGDLLSVLYVVCCLVFVKQLIPPILTLLLLQSVLIGRRFLVQNIQEFVAPNFTVSILGAAKSAFSAFIFEMLEIFEGLACTLLSLNLLGNNRRDFQALFVRKLVLMA